MASPEKLKTARGSIARLAEGLGVTRAAISKWNRIPAERVLKVEELTGISRHLLRPDLYPVGYDRQPENG